MNNNELPFATDEEYIERRQQLINSGIIKIGINNSKKIINALNRQELIKRGFINSNQVKIVKTIKKHSNVEEGEYQVKSIQTDEEYNKRKMNYFYMLQDIIFARKNLKLDLVDKKDTDPSWFF